ncbi:MAG: hypothetical protein GVY30_08235 [Chloroflexi bacterium]|jgi:hypothetical protein|nr:hypothetical protein [Chloroflexota bacterium]
MDTLLKVLIEILIENPLTISLVIGGIICVAIALIGEISTAIKITGFRALLLGLFGIFLILAAIGISWVLANVQIQAATQALSSDVDLTATITQPVPTSPSVNSSSLCPTTISRELIEEWSQIGETTKDTTLTYINEFDTMRIGGEFAPHDVLPAGVVIITDFGNGESLIYQQYPVRPIVHYRSWGVFETIGEYTAVQSGSCMSIAP